VPAKQRVRRHDGRERTQTCAAHPIRAHGESAPIVVGQLQASTPQLAAKHTILFEQIPKDISLLAIQPPGEERKQQLERGDVDHGGSLSHGAPNRGRRASIQSWNTTGIFTPDLAEANWSAGSAAQMFLGGQCLDSTTVHRMEPFSLHSNRMHEPKSSGARIGANLK
jgi:hypothetical protein